MCVCWSLFLSPIKYNRICEWRCACLCVSRAGWAGRLYHLHCTSWTVDALFTVLTLYFIFSSCVSVRSISSHYIHHSSGTCLTKHWLYMHSMNTGTPCDHLISLLLTDSINNQTLAFVISFFSLLLLLLVSSTHTLTRWMISFHRSSFRVDDYQLSLLSASLSLNSCVYCCLFLSTFGRTKYSFFPDSLIDRKEESRVKLFSSLSLSVHASFIRRVRQWVHSLSASETCCICDFIKHVLSCCIDAEMQLATWWFSHLIVWGRITCVSSAARSDDTCPWTKTLCQLLFWRFNWLNDSLHATITW